MAESLIELTSHLRRRLSQNDEASLSDMEEALNGLRKGFALRKPVARFRNGHLPGAAGQRILKIRNHMNLWFGGPGSASLE